jgi:hypothetical protein
MFITVPDTSFSRSAHTDQSEKPPPAHDIPLLRDLLSLWGNINKPRIQPTRNLRKLDVISVIVIPLRELAPICTCLQISHDRERQMPDATLFMLANPLTHDPRRKASQGIRKDYQGSFAKC